MPEWNTRGSLEGVTKGATATSAPMLERRDEVVIIEEIDESIAVEICCGSGWATACIDRAAAEAAPVMAADPSNSLMVSDLVELQLWRAEVRCLAAELGTVGNEALNAAEAILQEAISGLSVAEGASGASPSSRDRLARLRAALDRIRVARRREP